MRTGLGPAGSADAGSGRAITDAAGEKIGWIEAVVRSGHLDVQWIEVEAHRRGWGHGSEVVRLLEAVAATRDVRAEVPVANGLALYFWLRLGYRPQRADERKTETGERTERETMVMVREIPR